MALLEASNIHRRPVTVLSFKLNPLLDDRFGPIGRAYGVNTSVKKSSNFSRVVSMSSELIVAMD